MLARRLLVLIAVLMGLTALAAGVAPREPVTRTDEGGRAAPTAPATPSPAAASPAEPGEVVEETLSADPDARERRIVATRGQLVRLTVEGQVVDSVALGEFEVEAIDPVSPALFELLADEPGVYPITLLEADRRIGVLEVRG